MGDVPLWVKSGGTFNDSLNYVGGRCDGTLVKRDVDFDGMKQVLIDLLNVDPSTSTMSLKFVPCVEEKPLYDITDDRTLQFFMFFASQDPAKYKLLVTIDNNGRTSFEDKDQCEEPMQEQYSEEDLCELDSLPRGEINEGYEFSSRSTRGPAIGMGTKRRRSPIRNGPSPTTLIPDAAPQEVPLEEASPEVVQPTQAHSDEHCTSARSTIRGKTKLSNGKNTPTMSTPLEEVTTSDSFRRDIQIEDVEVKQIFSSKKDLVKRLSIVALRSNYEFKVFKSSPSLLVVRCINDNCNWRVRGVKIGPTDCWMVTKYVKEHSCSTDSARKHHRQAKSWIIGECVKGKFVAPGKVLKPKDIVEDMRNNYGITVTYDQAWRAIEIANESIEGLTPEKSFAILPSSCEVLKQTNPGTVTKIELSPDNRFKYLFIALSASISGYAHCRPVVSVDGTHLKGKYFGLMFTAVCRDGNNNILPLAFGIADSENDESWTWFLTRFKEVYGERTGLVIVSDRHSSITKAVKQVYPNVFHGICMEYLLNNLKTKFKSFASVLEPLFSAAAKAYQVSEFTSMFDALCSVDSSIKTYLEEFGHERWTRAHSPSKRYNIMTTNISEFITDILPEEGEFFITTLVEKWREMCRHWFYERRELADKCVSKLTPWAEELLKTNYQKSLQMNIVSASNYVFNVLDGDKINSVDMSLWTCSCREFQLNQLPCAHALVVVREERLDAYKFCDPFYTREAWHSSYLGVVQRMPQSSDWVVSEDVSNIQVLPPEICTRRRKRRRVSSSGEEVQQVNCSRCQQKGHNRATCKNQVASTG